jgi:hypothetical protein
VIGCWDYEPFNAHVLVFWVGCGKSVSVGYIHVLIYSFK